MNPEQAASPEFVRWLSAAYLGSGLLIAAHYLPLLRRAWCHPAATAQAQSLSTWSVWTICRLIAFYYGWVVLKDVVFLTVVGTDVAGRLAMAVLVIRARALVRSRPRPALPALPDPPRT